MITRIKRIFRTKDSKALIENFLSLSILKVVALLLPLLVLPHLIDTLGFSIYGVIVLAATLIAYFQSVTDYSFIITATRDVSLYRDSPLKLNVIFSKVLYVKGIFLFVSVAIVSCVVWLVPTFKQHSLIVFLTLPTLLGNSLFPDWFFQGIEKMKYITFVNVGIKLLFTAGVFIFIKSKDDFWVYPLLQSGGAVFGALIAQFILFRSYNLRLVRIRPRQIKTTIVNNFPIFVNRFMPTLYNNTSGFLLGLAAGTAWLGIYEALRRIIDICLILINMISRVFFPFMVRKKDFFKTYAKLILSLGVLLSVFPVVMFERIKSYLHIEYQGAFTVTLILALGVFFLSLYDLFGLNYFIVRRQDRVVMKNTIIASIVGFASAYPLIMLFGITGAAINLTFSRALMGLGMAWLYIKRKK